MAYYNSPLWDFFESVANQVDHVNQQHQDQRQSDEDYSWVHQPQAEPYFAFRPQSAPFSSPAYYNGNPLFQPRNPRNAHVHPQFSSQQRAPLPQRKPQSESKPATPQPPKPTAIPQPLIRLMDIPNQNSFLPPIDVYSTASEFKVFVSVPGASKSSTEVHYNPDTHQLTIEGEVPKPNFPAISKTGNPRDGAVPLLNERSTGRFARSLSLPADVKVDEEKITAKYKAGVLEVTVPKRLNSPTQRRKILIEDVPDEELVYESVEHNND